jgi:hypothetical protein
VAAHLADGGGDGGTGRLHARQLVGRLDAHERASQLKPRMAK